MKVGFYVYFHIKLSSPEVFYVGKGKGGRAFAGQRSKLWERVVAKHGYDVLIVEDDLTEEQSAELEKHYIAWFGRRDLGQGRLVNFTGGGEGSSGREFSTETRHRMSVAKKGKPSSNKGKVFSEEAKKNMSIGARSRTDIRTHSVESRERMSLSQRGNVSGKGNKGRQISDEHRIKLSLAHKGISESDATCKRLSESHRGLKHSEETKAKIGQAHRGMKRSEETRRKISESAKRRKK